MTGRQKKGEIMELEQELQRCRENSALYYKKWKLTSDERYIPTRYGKVRCLFYQPTETQERLSPVVFNLHGGGMVVHHAEMDQPFCEKLRARGIYTISVDYSLAPEAPWPHQIEETYDVIEYVWKNAETFGIDPTRIVIAGHSAGGYLAISASVLARENASFPICCQALDYPWVDLETPLKSRYCGVAKEMMQDLAFFKRCYYTDKMKNHILGSPLWLEDAHFEKMPPTILTMCEYDVLYEEDMDFLNKLVRNGVEVTVKKFAGVQHGFTCDFYYLPQAQSAQKFMIENIKRYL